MPFKLTKAEAAERAELVEKLTAAKTEVESAVAAFNEKLAEAWQEVQAKIETYNEVVTAAAEFRDGIVDSRQSEWDDKSEKWQDGERGEAASVWINEWSSASLDALEIEEPEGLEEPGMDHDEALEGLPEEMEG